jgi:hypothetical protein
MLSGFAQLALLPMLQRSRKFPTIRYGEFTSEMQKRRPAVPDSFDASLAEYLDAYENLPGWMEEYRDAYQDLPGWIDAYLDEHEKLPPAAAYTDCTPEVDDSIRFFDCASYYRDDHPMYYFGCDEGNSCSEGDWFLRLRVPQGEIDCVFESPEEKITDFEGDMALQLYITQTRFGKRRDDGEWCIPGSQR